MLWVYGRYKYVNSYSAGIDFTKVYPRAVRVKSEKNMHVIYL